MFLEQLSGALISLPRCERFKRNPVLGPFLKINTKRFTTAKGTGLEEKAGKEDPVELDSILSL